MTLELLEDEYGDPRNAIAMSLASDLSYLAEPAAAEGFKNELGLAAKLYSVGNTQAYVAVSDDHIVVAFRGTEAPTSIEGLKDWLLTDACNLLIVPEGRLGTDLAAAGVGARFHQGFVNALADIWEPVYTRVDEEMKKAERPLWVTGHSLGGALALLAAWLFQRKMINVHQVYTYGAPMIGNLKAVETFDREFENKIFRYVNSPDPVPKLPLMSLLSNEYGHCQKEIGVGDVSDAAEAAASWISAFAGKAVDGVLNATLVDDIWKSLNDRIGAHGMENYRALVGKLFK